MAGRTLSGMQIAIFIVLLILLGFNIYTCFIMWANNKVIKKDIYYMKVLDVLLKEILKNKSKEEKPVENQAAGGALDIMTKMAEEAEKNYNMAVKNYEKN